MTSLQLEQIVVEGLGYLLLHGKTTAEIKTKHVDWSSRSATVIAGAKSLSEGIRCVNYGQGSEETTKVIMVKHYAPPLCKTYRCSRSDLNRIDPSNPCIVPFYGWASRSLMHEAGHQPDEATAKQVEDGLRIVDMNVTIPKDKDTVIEETMAVCDDLGVSYKLLLLIGWMNAAFHMMHHHSITGTALAVVAGGACSRDTLFGGHDAISCIRGEYRGSVVHGQVLAMRLPLMNVLIYPEEALIQCNAILVEMFGRIGIPVPTTSMFCHRVGQRDGQGMTAQELEEHAEAIREACRRGGLRTGEIRTSAAKKVREERWGDMTDPEIAVYFGCMLGGMLGGAVTGEMRSAAAKLVAAGRADELTPKQKSLYDGCVKGGKISGEIAGKRRQSAAEKVANGNQHLLTAAEKAINQACVDGGTTNGEIRQAAAKKVAADQPHLLTAKERSLHDGSAKGGKTLSARNQPKRDRVVRTLAVAWLEHGHHFSFDVLDHIQGTTTRINDLRDEYAKGALNKMQVLQLQMMRFNLGREESWTGCTKNSLRDNAQLQYECQLQSSATMLLLEADHCSLAPDYYEGDSRDMIGLEEGLESLGKTRTFINTKMAAISETITKTNGVHANSPPTAAVAPGGGSRETIAANNEGGSYINKRIAKVFHGKIYRGDVTKYTAGVEGDGGCWRVVYEDGDDEDLDLEELRAAITLFESEEAKPAHSAPALPAAKPTCDSSALKPVPSSVKAATSANAIAMGARHCRTVEVPYSAVEGGGRDGSHSTLSVGNTGIIQAEQICDPYFQYGFELAHAPTDPPKIRFELDADPRVGSMLPVPSTKRKRGGAKSSKPPSTITNTLSDTLASSSPSSRKSRKSKVRHVDREMRTIADRKAMIIARKS